MNKVIHKVINPMFPSVCECGIFDGPEDGSVELYCGTYDWSEVSCSDCLESKPDES